MPSLYRIASTGPLPRGDGSGVVVTGRPDEGGVMDVLGVDLSGPASYWQVWQWVSVSIPNLIMIIVMLLLFVGALVLPFPSGGDHS